MTAPIPGRPRFVEVIDLLGEDDKEDSNNDSDNNSDMISLVNRPAPPRQPSHQIPAYHLHSAPDEPALDGTLNDQSLHADVGPGQMPGGAIFNIDGEEVFIPDEDGDNAFDFVAAADAAQSGTSRDRDLAQSLQNQDVPVSTFDHCLPHVLEIFPDISHEHVRNLYNEFDNDSAYETLPPQARLDNIIESLVSNPYYPKQEKGKKRRREESVGEQPKDRWENKERALAPPYLRTSMRTILKVEFPEIPKHYINETLATERHLFHAYVALANSQDDRNRTNRPYNKGRPSTRHHADAATIAAGTPWPELLDELQAARQRVVVLRAEYAAQDAKRKAEQENLDRAIAAGETAECSACYEDLPMNRQLHCDGSVAHFTCLECMERYIKSEVGDSRCRVLCPAGCGSSFAHNQLDLMSNKVLLQKLAQLQQEKDIRDAGLDDLEECPFCDYKVILPPVEEDFEFRCVNPECEKISCRRCKAVSHIPFTCEQHARDNKINSRHKVEEAMTAALIRSCNKCKKQFIKEYGCNKMTCPSCGNLQCYVCSATLKDYNHFDQNSPVGASQNANATKSKQCPLYDNVEERHEREVKEAEVAARARVVEENPDVTEEDLEIKVSDAVKQATADRINRTGGARANFLGVMPPFPAGLNVFPMGGDGAADAAEVLQQVRLQHEARERARVARREAARQRRERMNNPDRQRNRPWEEQLEATRPDAHNANALFARIPNYDELNRRLRFGIGPDLAPGDVLQAAPHAPQPFLPPINVQRQRQPGDVFAGLEFMDYEFFNDFGVFGERAGNDNLNDWYQPRIHNAAVPPRAPAVNVHPNGIHRPDRQLNQAPAQMLLQQQQQQQHHTALPQLLGPMHPPAYVVAEANQQPEIAALQAFEEAQQQMRQHDNTALRMLADQHREQDRRREQDGQLETIDPGFWRD